MSALSKTTVHLPQLGDEGWLEVEFYFTPAEKPVFTGPLASPEHPAEVELKKVCVLDNNLDLLPVLSNKAVEYLEAKILENAL